MTKQNHQEPYRFKVQWIEETLNEKPYQRIYRSKIAFDRIKKYLNRVEA